MKKKLLICLLTFWLVLVWSMVIAEDDFYVISTKKNNYAPVPKTGQTMSYAIGDDGELEKGVTSPNPRFTDIGNGTVKDNLTGLIWLKNANCSDATKSWFDALTYCNTLNSSECGLTDDSVEGDWRLPNVKELQSLIHYGFDSPALPNTAGTGQWTPGDPFTNVQSSYYWSATTHVHGTNNAWYVYMSDGLVVYRVKINGNYVWPVRAGQ